MSFREVALELDVDAQRGATWDEALLEALRSLPAAMLAHRCWARALDALRGVQHGPNPEATVPGDLSRGDALNRGDQRRGGGTKGPEPGWSGWRGSEYCLQ